MNRFALALTVSAIVSLSASPALAQKCERARLLTYGKHYSCVTDAQSKAIKNTGKVASPGQPACGDKMAEKWAKAEAYGDCIPAVPAATVLGGTTVMTNELTDTLAPGAPAISACSSLKMKTAGKYFYCRLKVVRASVTTGDPLDYTKCDAKLTSGFAKAESLGAADCLTSLDVETARTQVAEDADDVAAQLDDTTTTTTQSTTTTTSTMPPGDPSDSFGGVALDPSWTVLNPSVATVSVSGGQLHLQINTLTNWFNAIESVLVYKQVTGDFDAHTTLHATKTSNLTAEPDPEYRLGGLLARDPASSPADSNFVHVALGASSNVIGPAAEDKSTIDSSSTYFFYDIPETQGELRLTRVGSLFSMYYRPIGDMTWQLLNSHVRNDLPATLQVGMMAYDFNGSPDFTMHFDEVVFE